MTSSGRGDVELRGISKRFGAHVAVQPLDLAIRGGEFVALLGSSGCGKTTTLRLVGGFEVADTGRIFIGGSDVTDTPPHQRPVNTVFQHYALFPHMTVADNVGYGLRRRGVSREVTHARVAHMLEQVAMEPWADHWPAELSGGQQQRVALARALINEPAVLLLDEPLGALDRQLRQRMQVELKQMQRRLGMTFLYVTHDQDEALSMADRVAVMHDGRLEQVATPTDIYDQPASVFVAAFVGQQNFFIGKREDSRTVLAGVCRIVAADHVAVSDDVVVAAVRPEEIRLLETDPGDRNAVRATVLDVVALGDTLQYVMASSDQQIVVRQPKGSAQRPAVGAERWCAWAPSAVRLFGGAEAARAAEAARPRGWGEAS